MARSSSFSLVSSLAATIFDPLRGLRILRVSLPLAFRVQQPTFHVESKLALLVGIAPWKLIFRPPPLFPALRLSPPAARNETPSAPSRPRFEARLSAYSPAFRILSFFFSFFFTMSTLFAPLPLLLRRLACLHPLVNPSIPRESIDFLASYEASGRLSRNPSPLRLPCFVPPSCFVSFRSIRRGQGGRKRTGREKESAETHKPKNVNQ